MSGHDRPTTKVWKTITIGGKTRDELLAALEAAGYKTNVWARKMMSHDAYVTEPWRREVDVAPLSVARLGLSDGARTRDIWARAQELGYELCPPSLGPHFRLAYTDQMYDGWLWIAMEQIAVSDHSPGIFLVEHTSAQQLRGYSAWPTESWHRSAMFLFVVPRRGEEVSAQR